MAYFVLRSSGLAIDCGCLTMITVSVELSKSKQQQTKSKEFLVMMERVVSNSVHVTYDSFRHENSAVLCYIDHQEIAVLSAFKENHLY
jgi:hypothetical protein